MYQNKHNKTSFLLKSNKRDFSFFLLFSFLFFGTFSAEAQVDNYIFASSGSSGMTGVFPIMTDGSVSQTLFTTAATDADGIFYDETNDVLYQLNRTDNRIDLYSTGATGPTLIASSSTSDFSNGREIAVSGNKLVVVQDANTANGDQNKLIIYDITPTSISLNKAYEVSINLWGIHANGNQLFAVVDNSNSIAVFDNFFNQPAGAVTATATVSIENLIRTHGITYDAVDDMMYLTDVGDATNDRDGALIAVKNWSEVSADGMISASEQGRASGAASKLGNPVDIAIDKNNRRVYVAEAANEGGRILGFKMPILTGGIAPALNYSFPGASAVHIPGTEVDLEICDFLTGGTVSLPNGNTSTTIVVDGTSDFVPFLSSVDAAANGYDFTFVITDAANMVLGVPGGNINDFDGAGIGACNVYGLSYTGNLSVMMGDDLLGGQNLSDDCFELSSNKIVVNRIAPSNINGQVFSSGNEGLVNYFNITNSGNLVPGYFTSNAAMADGIHFDEANDVLYQLNRTNNVINIYGSVNASLQAGTNPSIIATSSSDFTNGRGIAVSGGKLVVAQDGNAGNGEQNKFVIYDITPTSIALDKILDANINLWGIELSGDKLFAVSDNTSDIAVYDDFFNQPAGAIMPTATVSISDLVRTHGIAYDAEEDYMILTDVGAASVAGDGALVTIKNWTTASADGTVDMTEQVRNSGGTSFLGNPVDVAYDKANQIIYVAEAARDGGRILGFKKPRLTGGIAPTYNILSPGASSVSVMSTDIVTEPCTFVKGSTVNFTDGSTEQIIFVDGVADELFFTSTADPVGNSHSFTYVVTDGTGMVLGVPPSNSNNFDPAGIGSCNVYGLSYTGTLYITVGDDLFGGQDLSDACFELSTNSLTVNRIAPEPLETTVYISSNMEPIIGTYGVLANSQFVPGSIASGAADADGIHYDDANDVLYQLNRTSNVIKIYNDVSTNPTIVGTSTSDFINGRGLTVSGNKLVVAQDADPANGNVNQFVIYDITTTSAVLDKILIADINLWGIHADGDRLIAVSDNTGSVAIYDNFFGQPAGAITPTQTVRIEGLVRTHGLDYDRADDMLILTDIGDAADDNDGALVVVRDFAKVSSDDVVERDEHVRVFAGAAFLGNPVDVTLDKANKRVYVAERARDGGRILGFKLPKATGGIAPESNRLFSGASSVFIPEGPCDFLTGGAVTFTDGTTEKNIIVGDGIPDILSFVSDVDAAAGGYSQRFVVTDVDGIILGLPMTLPLLPTSNDFEGAGVGICRVFNVSYTGNFLLNVGDDLYNDQISDACAVRSDKSLLVFRTENKPTNDGVDNRTNDSNTEFVSKIFPVPTRDRLNVIVETSTEKELPINILNMNGAVVLRRDAYLFEGQNRISFNVGNLPEGIYFLQLPGEGSVIKFVKTN